MAKMITRDQNLKNKFKCLDKIKKLKNHYLEP